MQAVNAELNEQINGPFGESNKKSEFVFPFQTTNVIKEPTFESVTTDGWLEPLFFPFLQTIAKRFWHHQFAIATPKVYKTV